MGLNAYRLNEYEVWAGETQEQAIEAAMRETGNTREETVDELYCREEPRDLRVRADTEEESYRTVGEILDEMSGPGLAYGYGD